ncbi:MAG: SsrA-binding protein SmpB [Acidobacteria bacterium]|nr:SsrA-binding protein SmpB [Acidobacteriota bacterium]
MAPNRDRTNPGGRKLIASNRRARHDYTILESIEAGIVLTGSEVKALREGHAQIGDAFARILRGQVWIDGMHIPPYQYGHGVGAHDPNRERKLLMHRREIDRLAHQIAVEHLALIPLSMYFKDGRVKVELGLARGRKKADKRQVMAERDSKMEIAKALGRQRKGTDR